MTAYHTPVMIEESITGLAIKPNGIYLDGTLGGGGHFKMIVESLHTSGTAVGIDRDSEAIHWVKEHIGQPACNVILEQSTFSQFDAVLKKHGIKSLDGLVLDLGVSSHQLNGVERGFTYIENAPLDMRMDQNDTLTAAGVLADINQESLCRILQDYGEVRNPQRMAEAIARFTKEHTIKTSDDLRECLECEYGSPIKYKVLAKVFQAFRIAVNDELAELRTCLTKAVNYLNTGGRLVVIAYHSLEDRIVKNFFKKCEQQCECALNEPVCRCNKVSLLMRINRKVYRASHDEIAGNRRARSARLRIAEKV